MNAVCSLRSAVCGLQSAVCSLRSAVCGLQSAVCSLRSAVCGLQSAVCSLRSAVCGLQSAVCSLRSAVCGLQSAVCSLRSAVCGLQSAVCSLHLSDTAVGEFINNQSMDWSTNQSINQLLQPISCLNTMGLKAMPIDLCICIFLSDNLCYLIRLHHSALSSVYYYHLKIPTSKATYSYHPDSTSSRLEAASRLGHGMLITTTQLPHATSVEVTDNK